MLRFVVAFYFVVTRCCLRLLIALPRVVITLITFCCYYVTHFTFTILHFYVVDLLNVYPRCTYVVGLRALRCCVARLPRYARCPFTVTLLPDLICYVCSHVVCCFVTLRVGRSYAVTHVVVGAPVYVIYR